MRIRKTARFVLEVAFLAGLATLATVAHLHAGAVIAVMVFGWVVVALVEWSAWLDRPHFGRGLPPRFYVPQASLPPPLPLEQRAARLPAPGRNREEEETRVVSQPRWPSSLDEWPVIDLERLGEDTVSTRSQALSEQTQLAPPGSLVEQTELAGLEGAPPESALPFPQLPLPSAALVPPREPTDRRSGSVDGAEVSEPEGSESEASVAPVSAPAVPGGVVSVPVDRSRLARHTIDPFVQTGGSGTRWRRREAGGTIEVPDRPSAERPPPAASRRADPSGRD